MAPRGPRSATTGIGIPRGGPAPPVHQILPLVHRPGPRDPRLWPGLNIIESIARNHGGTVALVSERGRGTTFTVTLPLLDRMAA
jgi:light-regulated signal transduction histidine kinase (bacteriophytochrome)